MQEGEGKMEKKKQSRIQAGIGWNLSSDLHSMLSKPLRGLYDLGIICWTNSQFWSDLSQVKMKDLLSLQNGMMQMLHFFGVMSFCITLKMDQWKWEEAMDLHANHQAKPYYNELLEFITSDPVVAMEILGDDAIGRWKQLLGPANSVVARTDAPNSIRARFGSDSIRNVAHGPDSFASAASELELFFPSNGGRGPAGTAKYTHCTCCVIKPHAIKEGLAGKIIKAILDGGFEISALQMFYMDRANAEEFYAVYKGVVAEYSEMVVELYSGPCIALEIRQVDPEKVFRDYCGPSDPEIARYLRPGTIRAHFGKNKIQNAVHCTDLPEDGLLEVQYFFSILDS
ncbi:nucleoside diphosphate kinase homolog 7 isoform 4-T6 [Vipera latastei]